MLSNLYKIIKKDDEDFRIELASDEHTIFKAHFPNNPVLPAFIMIEICSKILNHEVKGIKKAKFIYPALPLDILDFFVSVASESVVVKIQKDDKKIAEIIYEKI